MSDNVQKMIQILVDAALPVYDSYKESLSIEDFTCILEKSITDTVTELSRHITEEQMNLAVEFLSDRKLANELATMNQVAQVVLTTKLLGFFMGGGESQLDKELENRDLLKEMGLE